MCFEMKQEEARSMRNATSLLARGLGLGILSPHGSAHAPTSDLGVQSWSVPGASL